MQENKMKKFDIYIGCNVTGKEAYSREVVRFVAEQALTELEFDGCTFTDAIGKWKGETEQTVVCTVCTDRRSEMIHILAGIIKDRLRQESVLVIESEPEITFIS
jgi:hypothetical protein